MTGPKSAGRNIVLLSAGSIVGSLALAIRGLVIARTVGPAGYGDFALAFAFAGTFVYGFILGMDVVVPRELARDSSLLGRLVPSVMAPALIWSAILIVAIIGLGASLGYSRNVLILLACAAPTVALQGLSALLNSVYRGLDRMELDALFRALDGVMGLILAGAVVLLSRSIVGTALAALVATALVFAVSAYVTFRLRVAGREFIPGFFLNMIGAALPLGIAVLIAQSGQNISMLVLGRLSSARDVGFYGAAFGVAMMSSPLQMAYAAAFLPKLSLQALESTKKPMPSYESGLRFALAFGSPIGVATTMLAPFFLNIFYGKQFIEGTLALRILGLAIVFASQNMYLWQVHAALGNRKSILAISLVSILVAIGLSLLLIPLFGIAGAALAVVTRETVQTLMFLGDLQRRWRTIGLRYQSACSIALASLGMAACLWSIRLSTKPIVLAFLAGATIVYGVLLLASGGARKEELRGLIPGECVALLAARHTKI